MDYEMNLEAQHKQSQVRKLAHKLANNRSKKRVVRRLPRAYTIVRRRGSPLNQVRTSLNTHKVGGYALLVGLALAAFILDFNDESLASLRETVNEFATLPSQLFGKT